MLLVCCHMLVCIPMQMRVHCACCAGPTSSGQAEGSGSHESAQPALQSEQGMTESSSQGRGASHGNSGSQIQATRLGGSRDVGDVESESIAHEEGCSGRGGLEGKVGGGDEVPRQAVLEEGESMQGRQLHIHNHQIIVLGAL